MSQHYSNPNRESDPYALPDLEVFKVRDGEPDPPRDDDGTPLESGWYYWYCFPGCLPDSSPVGPFATKAEALADAQAADIEIPGSEEN